MREEGGREPGGVTEAQTFLQMGSGHDRVTPIERYMPQVYIALLPQGRVVLVWPQAEELLAHLVSQAQLGLENMKLGEALERLAALPRLPYLLTQRVGPGVDLAHFRHCVPLRRHQSLSQEKQQREFVLAARGALREGRQHRQPVGESGDRFVMGIAPSGIVGRLLEILHGALALTPALEVEGELGRDFSRPGAIPRLQPPANAPVQLPPPRCP